MKKLLSLAILASTMALTACGGGDSDSSGSTSIQPTNNSTPAFPTTGNNTTPAPTGNACEVNGSTVYATSTGCTYSHPTMNNGANITYTCTADKRIQSSIGINSKNVVLNGMTITCKP